MREISILSDLKHPNIIEIKKMNMALTEKCLEIVFDFYEYDLRSYLDKF